MSAPSSTTAIVPVCADEIAKKSYEQRFLIEDRVVMNFIEVVNQGIRDQVHHGLLAYEFHVPSFIYGFPKFNVDYVGERLRGLYEKRGFCVSGEGKRVRVEWPVCANAPAPTPTSTTSKTSTMHRRG